MKRFYLATRISDHMATTPEGYLVCRDAVLCRTAVHHPQAYEFNELGLRDNSGRTMISVYRMPQEVLSEATLASLEGKAICDGHPRSFLNSENTQMYAKGHVQNVRVGPRLANGEQSVIADLIITDSELIRKIRSGQAREISVGYDTNYYPHGDYALEQRTIRANHVAIVETGRAGSTVRIQDSGGHVRKDPLDELIALLKERLAKRHTRSHTVDERRAEGRDFEHKARQYHRHNFDVHGERIQSSASEPPRLLRQACDSRQEEAAQFEENCRRVREWMLKKGRR